MINGIAIFGYIAKYFLSLMEVTNNSRGLSYILELILTISLFKLEWERTRKNGASKWEGTKGDLQDHENKSIKKLYPKMYPLPCWFYWNRNDNSDVATKYKI